jgi:GcrA cell cycle regulator
MLSRRAPIFASGLQSRGWPFARTNALSAAQYGRGNSEAIPMHAPLANAPSLSSLALSTVTANESPSPAIAVIAVATAAATAPVPSSVPCPLPSSPPRIPASSPWTPERIAQLKTCFAAGMTCSEIGAAIGVSRNAVIGKIHRLGLSGERPAGVRARANNCPPRARHPRRSTQRSLLRLAFAREPLGEEVTLDTQIASLHPCSLIDIADRQCRWPIGDPASTHFLFCGNDAIKGFTYCLGHARMAYRAPAGR